MNKLYERINEILKLEIDNNDILDISREEIISRFLIADYGWECVQDALFSLLIENRSSDDYYVVEQVFWSAILHKYEIEKDKAVALINYRCNSFDYPFEDNLAWSITSSLYDLDYADSEYNPFRDDKIQAILKEYGFQLPI